MKKVFTFCLFALTLLLSTQTATAQDIDVAAEKTKELSSQLKIDNEASTYIYEAYRIYESKVKSIKQHTKKDSQEYSLAMNSTKEVLQTKIKKALGPDLYERYLIIEEQQKNNNEKAGR